jgi:uncharacterized membrane protein YfcA
VTFHVANVAWLAAAALLAGTVDAIAGGGGLITLPALLLAGLPAQLALGTNKGQSVFGALASLLGYARAGRVDGPRARLAFPAALVGSAVGAWLVLRARPEVLRPVVLALLLAAAAVLAVRPLLPATRAAVPDRFRALAVVGTAALIGCYDGFFGPGTGTFLIVAFTLLFAAPLVSASADAKVVNFASNLAAVALFALRGNVLWRIALPMAAGQLCGGWLGAHLAIRTGNALVRWIALGVCLALLVKLGLELRN